MYAVTFYSFKGGVGRTLALVNVASELARLGRKILIVDFDIEAPGLTSFEFAEHAANSPGIVDYVCDYLKTRQSPDVSNYLTECVLPVESAECELPTEGAPKIWLMPAGRQDEAYESKLSQINWDDLYRYKSGYLMIEDLKEQWRSALAPDYVFVDSRTGHTDVSGICTRQIPDVTVMLFFPNSQNLAGMEKISNQIEAQNEKDRDNEIELIYVSSNTPALDDEHQILERNLGLFKEKIGYSSCETIHHYDSLALLDQSIFVLERANTRLATEYRSLAKSIIKRNPEDRDGAIAFLQDLEGQSDSFREVVDRPTKIERYLSKIRVHHSGDPEVLSLLGDARSAQGALDAAVELYELSVDRGEHSSSMFRNLATIYRQQGEIGKAVDSLKSMLQIEAEYFDLLLAVRWLAELDIDSLDSAISSPAVQSLDLLERHRVADQLTSNFETLPYAVKMLEQLLDDPEAEEYEKGYFRQGIILSKIGLGEFDDALRMIGSRKKILASDYMPPIFNYAMAEWGRQGRGSPDFFERVLALNDDTPNSNQDPNFAQCMAITNWALGNKTEAQDWCDAAERLAENMETAIFSPWRYYARRPRAFIQDVEELRTAIEKDDYVLPFMRRRRLL